MFYKKHGFMLFVEGLCWVGLCWVVLRCVGLCWVVLGWVGSWLLPIDLIVFDIAIAVCFPIHIGIWAFEPQWYYLEIGNIVYGFVIHFEVLYCFVCVSKWTRFITHTIFIFPCLIGNYFLVEMIFYWFGFHRVCFHRVVLGGFVVIVFFVLGLYFFIWKPYPQ